MCYSYEDRIALAEAGQRLEQEYETAQAAQETQDIALLVRDIQDYGSEAQAAGYGSGEFAPIVYQAAPASIEVLAALDAIEEPEEEPEEEEAEEERADEIESVAEDVRAEYESLAEEAERGVDEWAAFEGMEIVDIAEIDADEMQWEGWYVDPADVGEVIAEIGAEICAEYFTIGFDADAGVYYLWRNPR